MDDSDSTKSRKPTYVYDRDTDTITELTATATATATATDTGTPQPQPPLIDAVLFPELLITCEGGGKFGSGGNETRITNLRLVTSDHVSGGCSPCMSRLWYIGPSAFTRSKLLEQSNREPTIVRRTVGDAGKRMVQTDQGTQGWFGHLLERVTREAISTDKPIGGAATCTAATRGDTLAHEPHCWKKGERVDERTQSHDSLKDRGIHTAIKSVTDKGGGRWVYEFGISWADEGPWAAER
ncbi:hypothetical protein JCM24511_02479 [Saitozyma sp. JCM 24511]|nr:hypothetical protein JCM24511_02479 [Saitozyma sp. JCM 24511]